MLHLRCGKVHCGIIMRTIVLFLIFTEAHISLAAQQYSIMRDQSLHYQNGDCWFRGYNLPQRTLKDMEKPCEEWKCYLHSDGYPRVEVKGCDEVPISERYYLEIDQNNTNLFPKCCSEN
uniref:Single domain-containing protein n=1 Tax=Amblyomma americanum TaxID=6943 RepID=A0A0C9SEU7_AMBAM